MLNRVLAQLSPADKRRKMPPLCDCARGRNGSSIGLRGKIEPD